MDSVVVAMFIGVVTVGLILLAVISMTRNRAPGLDIETFRSKWLKIESSVLGEEASSHLAILNADKLLDEALKARGFKGKTMGSRMKNAGTTLSNNNAVWAAHKLRNRIAHESDVSIQAKTVRYTLQSFKKALQDLGAL